MARSPLRRGKMLALGLSLALLASACGDDSGQPSVSESTDGTESSSDFQRVIDAAKEEGTVTLYTSWNSVTNLNTFTSLFTKTYGIEVEIVQGGDNVLIEKIRAENDIGQGVADVVNHTTYAEFVAEAKDGFFTPASGPNLHTPLYQESGFLTEGGTIFEVGANLQGMAWNTELYPQGLEVFEDFLDPSLSDGKIGVLEPQSLGFVLFWEYLKTVLGEDEFPEYLAKLGAQGPRIYQRGAALAQALAAGEVYVGIQVSPLGDLQATGAPVESGPGELAAAFPFYGAILKSAPHPNAAQLLGDFMLSPEGQQALSRDQSSALPDIPGAVTDDSKIFRPDVSSVTPEYVETFQREWAALFQKR